MRMRLARSRLGSLFAVATLSIASVAFSPAAVAADDEAMARFERGVQLYDAENYEGALVEFNAAYKLTNNYKLLYNIGICQNATKDYAASADSFTKYLGEGGADVSDARKKDVQERLAKLALMVTRVKVTTDAPSGSTLLVDDQPVGTTPLPDTIAIKIGRRQFSITSHGRTVAAKTVDVASGDQHASVNLLLSEGSSKTSSPINLGGDSPGTKPQNEDAPSFPWIFWGLTAAFGGASAITGILAVDARNDLGEKRATFGVAKSALEDDQDKAQKLGIATDVLLGATLISAGVSTALTIRYFGKKKSQAGQPAGNVMILPLSIGYSRSF
jgi:hypothetical protein